MPISLTKRLRQMLTSQLLETQTKQISNGENLLNSDTVNLEIKFVLGKTISYFNLSLTTRN